METKPKVEQEQNELKPPSQVDPEVWKAYLTSLKKRWEVYRQLADS